MRDLFWEYYTPSDEYFSHLWQDATFVFDTNVLLHFYRYTSATRDELLRIIESLQDRVWLPHQVGLEFSRSRISVILDQNKIFDLIKSFDTFVREEIEKKILQQYGTRGHYFADLKKIRDILQQTKQSLQEELDQARTQYSNSMVHDQLLERLDTIFKGRIGPPYSDDKMTELSKEFKKRYEKKIPPGFKDITKNNTNKNQPEQKKQEDQGDESNNPENIYGDVLLWFQIIDYAKQEKRPIILVVDDRKEDWWQSMHGQKLGPKSELRREMNEKADVPFYMYDADNFIRKARDFLNVEVSSKTIGEIREISVQDAKEQKEITAMATVSYIVGPSYSSGVLQDLGQQLANVAGNLSQQAQIGQQLANVVGNLSQQALGSRLYQNLYGSRQPLVSDGEQQQENEENLKALQGLEDDEQE